MYFSMTGVSFIIYHLCISVITENSVNYESCQELRLPVFDGVFPFNGVGRNNKEIPVITV
jgi:hypothetical protein